MTEVMTSGSRTLAASARCVPQTQYLPSVMLPSLTLRVILILRGTSWSVDSELLDIAASYDIDLPLYNVVCV